MATGKQRDGYRARARDALITILAAKLLGLAVFAGVVIFYT